MLVHRLILFMLLHVPCAYALVKFCRAHAHTTCFCSGNDMLMHMPVLEGKAFIFDNSLDFLLIVNC